MKIEKISKRFNKIEYIFNNMINDHFCKEVKNFDNGANIVILDYHLLEYVFFSKDFKKMLKIKNRTRSDFFTEIIRISSYVFLMKYCKEDRRCNVFIDHKGNYIIPQRFISVERINNRLYMVEKKTITNEYVLGIIDIISKKIVVSIKYDKIIEIGDNSFECYSLKKQKLDIIKIKYDD